MGGKCVVQYVGCEDHGDEAYGTYEAYGTLDIDSDSIIKKREFDNIGPRHSRLRTGVTRRYRRYAHSYGYSYCGSLPWYVYLIQDREEVEQLKGFDTYENKKYSKNYKAKKWYPQKRELRRKMGKHIAKSGAKRIENKMKKFK